MKAYGEVDIREIPTNFESENLHEINRFGNLGVCEGKILYSILRTNRATM
jgi:hypothetical protein